MKRLKHVLVTGRTYPTAPRGLALREGLRLQGVKVSEVTIDHKTSRPWGWKLERRLDQFKEPVDAVILADLGQEVFHPAWRAAQRLGAPLFSDFFFSMHEALVHDRAVVGEDSFQARRAHKADLDTLKLSDACFFDTREHLRYALNAFPGALRRGFVVPIGCPMAFFEEQTPKPLDGWGGFNVLFWGSYIPLQGIEHIIHAAHALRNEPGIVFHLIGKQGQTYAAMRDLEQRLKPGNVRFVDRIDPEKLRSHIKAADLALGIFGSTPKASRVVPHKVYEALAMGVPCVSMRSPAMNEWIPREACLQVEPSTLATSILELRSDETRRRTLGRSGAEFMLKHLHPRELGRILIEGIEGHSK
ncbi:MAG: glycosyltransferase [Planctomycetota bacterium]